MVSRQTMSNWLLRCADDWLSPIYDELHKQLLEHDLLHADETELQVLHEDGKSPQSKSCMWLYRTGGDAKTPIVLYDYRPGRGQEYPKTFLEGSWVFADRWLCRLMLRSARLLLSSIRPSCKYAVRHGHWFFR